MPRERLADGDGAIEDADVETAHDYEYPILYPTTPNHPQPPSRHPRPSVTASSPPFSSATEEPPGTREREIVYPDASPLAVRTSPRPLRSADADVFRRLDSMIGAQRERQTSAYKRAG
jgi:hypothetical protein